MATNTMTESNRIVVLAVVKSLQSLRSGRPRVTRVSLAADLDERW